jgi:GT2 family glycosyltransferase
MAASKQPRVSVIIPTYQREDSLILTLACFLLQEYPKDRLEIIVVDQSESHTKSVQRRLESWHELGEIRWLRRPEIDFVSIPQARNYGISQAHKPDIIIFTDDDVELRPDFVQYHVTPYDDAAVGAVAGKVIVPTRTYNLDARMVGHITWFGSFVNNFYLDFPLDVDNVLGSNFSVRSSVLKEVGAFDERFRGSALFDANDFAVRVREAGHVIQYEPFTGLLHHKVLTGGRHVAQHYDSWHQDYFYNLFLFYRKHTPAWRMPFFAVRSARLILAYWLWYRKGNPAALFSTWHSIREGMKAARQALKKGDTVVANPKLRVF